MLANFNISKIKLNTIFEFEISYIKCSFWIIMSIWEIDFVRLKKSNPYRNLLSKIQLHTGISIFLNDESKYPIAYNEISCSQRREANLMYYYKTASETKLVEETEHGQIAMTWHIYVKHILSCLRFYLMWNDLRFFTNAYQMSHTNHHNMIQTDLTVKVK